MSLMLFNRFSKFVAKSEEVFEIRKVFTIPQYDKKWKQIIAVLYSISKYIYQFT